MCYKFRPNNIKFRPNNSKNNNNNKTYVKNHFNNNFEKYAMVETLPKQYGRKPHPQPVK